jgi:phytoene dehydrogenase-like protein
MSSSRGLVFAAVQCSALSARCAAPHPDVPSSSHHALGARRRYQQAGEKPDILEAPPNHLEAGMGWQMLEVWARYAPNMTRKNIIAQHIYTGREYVAEFPQMRGGDIFMDAFCAEQVMYSHFGYRTPIANLYMASSAAHSGGAISGGAGYITAGLIARDLDLKV